MAAYSHHSIPHSFGSRLCFRDWPILINTVLVHLFQLFIICANIVQYIFHSFVDKHLSFSQFFIITQFPIVTILVSLLLVHIYLSYSGKSRSGIAWSKSKDLFSFMRYCQMTLQNCTNLHSYLAVCVRASVCDCSHLLQYSVTVQF